MHCGFTWPSLGSTFRLLICASLLSAIQNASAADVSALSATTTTATPIKIASAPTSTINAQTLDAVIVTIADEPLLLSELQKAISMASSRQTRLTSDGQLLGGSLSTTDAEIILEQLINQKILSIRTRELGLNLSEDELDAELSAFLKQQNISEEQFHALLEKEGETVDSHREEFRKQVETQRFIGRVIRPLVSVTDDQVRGFYMQQNADKERAQLVRLRSLMIEFPNGLSSDERQAKKRNIETIQRDINSGRPFIELVQLFSEAKDALKTKGELPPKPLQELPEKVRSRLKGKTPPMVVGPIELGSSVFFFEFIGTELGDQKEYERLKPQFEAKLLDIKFRERLDDYLRTERLKVKVNKRPFRFSR